METELFNSYLDEAERVFYLDSASANGAFLLRDGITGKILEGVRVFRLEGETGHDLGITGKEAEAVLGKAGITVNKNSIPFETRSPFVTSGIRIGTPAVTTRGMGEGEMEVIADLIVQVLKNPQKDSVVQSCREKVWQMCENFMVDQG